MRNDQESKKLFVKEISREYSLIRLANWYVAMSKHLKEITGFGLNEFCGVYRGSGLVETYYEKSDFANAMTAGAKKCLDVEYMSSEIDTFLELFKELKLYYDGKKHINDIEEFKHFHELYSREWAYIGVVTKVPLLPVDESLKKKAYEARVKTQEFTESPNPVYREFIEKNFPILKDNTDFVLVDEIYSGEASKPEILVKIEERKKGFVFYHGKVYSGKTVDEILDDLDITLEKVDMEAKKIKGQVANVGKVIGIVRVVLDDAEISTVQNGEILVAIMTMPKYLPAMKRAAAFVTDEGGVTCHAAIISREMNKPCIIGTKIATKVLKNGMEVEVDADSGVVKIV